MRLWRTREREKPPSNKGTLSCTAALAPSLRTIVPANPGAAAGGLNLMGNLGGVFSIWLVPRMSAAWGWNGTLTFWAGVAFVAALLWLGVHSADEAPARAAA